MKKTYRVVRYGIGTLRGLLAKTSGALPEVVDSKLHCAYFQGYFSHSGLHARTIIAEYDYICRDFLDDFANYYVRCFGHYRKTCARLHFFNIPFNQESFDNLLAGTPTGVTEDQIKNAYLGFIVVKRLPKTIIGRTCLKGQPYMGSGEVLFADGEDCQVNLFGIQMGVRTIPFQEQDRVVAACATSALWSVFHVTAREFQHQILSPIEITKAAMKGMPSRDRPLPNNGLYIDQMANAARTVGLEPVCLPVSRREILLNTLYAYVRGKVPAILGVALVDTTGKGKPREMGMHAVAVTGYSLGSSQATPSGKAGILCEASRIETLYVHDDQIGPFASMPLGPDVVTRLPEEDGPTPHQSLQTLWRGDDGKSGHVLAVPWLALIPLYHKIRIPFEVIYNGVAAFDLLLRSVKFLYPSQPLVWDVYLITARDLKAQLLTDSPVPGIDRKRILTESQPRFLWRAIARCGNQPVLELLFDATDIEQAGLLKRAIEYDTDLAKVLRLIAGSDHILKLLMDQVVVQQGNNGIPLLSKILDWFRHNP